MRKRIYIRFKESASAYVPQILAFFLLIIILRVLEFFYTGNLHDLPKNSFVLELISIRFDLYFILNIAGLLFVPFFIISLIRIYPAMFFLRFLLIALLLAQTMLVIYFGTTSLMLSSDLYGYSFEEIVSITGASGGFNISRLLPLLIIIAASIFLFRFAEKIKIPSSISVLAVVICVFSLLFYENFIPSKKEYASEMHFNLANNKLAYFMINSYAWFFIKTEPSEQMLYPYFYTNVKVKPDAEFKYLSNDYPFLKKDETQDVLGNFFNIGTKKPNIVFIIVESLARAYSGENAYLKSFTPFVDSLMTKSLYWENALSTSGRTFEVFPSLFGSLPYGNNGFCEMGERMPLHQSILKLLKQNGYLSSFYYGGDAKFDNMAMFLKKQGVDNIIDESKFGPAYSKIPKKSNGFTWGYADKEIFTKMLEITNKTNVEPRADIILTLAMHDPYIIPNQEAYIEKFETFLTKFGFDEEKKNEYRKYKENYSTIIYFDDAIRDFFKKYFARSDFSNTIFVITGDHRMSTPPIATQIDRFHVPVIIYSPMLKRIAKFSSVTSHLSITPSLVQFLRKNYNMSFPVTCHWMGAEFDTTRTFRCNISMPFIRTKSETIDYLDKNYFISGDQLFYFPGNLFIEPSNDQLKFNEINSKFERFKSSNRFACDNNRLAPDSLVKK